MFQQSSPSSRQMTLPSAHWLESEIDSFPRVSSGCSQSWPSLPDFNSNVSPRSSTPLRCLPQLYLFSYLSYWKGFLVGLPASFCAFFSNPFFGIKQLQCSGSVNSNTSCRVSLTSAATPPLTHQGPGVWASSQVFRCYKSFSILWIAILLLGMCVSFF